MFYENDHVGSMPTLIKKPHYGFFALAANTFERKIFF